MPSLTSNLYGFEEFRLDPQSRVLSKGKAVVPLTPKAFDVLLLLVQNAGKIVTKDELMTAVWPGSFVEESNLTQTVFMVRKALKETADHRYIQTVQGQGYRFLVPVTELTHKEPETEEPRSEAGGSDRILRTSAEAAVPSNPPRTNASKAYLAGWIAVLMVMVALAIWWRLHRSTTEQSGKIMLAVLPFENFTGDPGQEYFSDGLTEEMISQLGDLDPVHLRVIARTSVMQYKHAQASIPQIGKNLGVQYVIEGSVRRDAERVRITAQLIQVKDQSHLWAREYDRDLGHLLQLQEEIAREVANEIEVSLGSRQPIRAPLAGPPAGANSYEAYDLYLKGRYFWNKRTGDGFRQAAEYFQQAIDKDANYGRAYAGLADTFSLMSTWYLGPQNELMPKARAAALRALELDDTLAEAHSSLALIKENYEYDWAGAEKEFRRAIQLDPQYATAHQWYAEFLCWQGRFDEALGESERARQLDPLSPIIGNDRATILYHSRQYESALQQARSVLELDPNNDHVRDSLVPMYLQLGRYDKAFEGLRRWEAQGEDSWVLAWKAAAFGKAGKTEEARTSLARLEKISASQPERIVALLIAYSGMGDRENVIELLQQAYSEHSNAVLQIKVDPMYDPYRSDTRFAELLRRTELQR